MQGKERRCTPGVEGGGGGGGEGGLKDLKLPHFHSPCFQMTERQARQWKG